MRKRHKQKNYADPAVEWVVNEIKDKIPKVSEHRQLSSGAESEHHSALKLRTAPITCAFPLDELMYSKFFTNFLHLNIMPWDSVITTESTYLPDARNYVHEIFLDKFKTEFLFMLDSDVLPPPYIVDTLLKHDKPIVAGWYRKKEQFEYKDLEGNSYVIGRPVVYDWSEERDGKFWFTQRVHPGEGTEKVAGVGMGSVLLRRDLAEKLGKRPYDMNAGGEDLVLCKKVMDLDVPLYVDWSLACAHTGVSIV